MPKQPKKFNSVRATRLSLLMVLSLTVGIGISIYAPMAQVRPTKAAVQQPAQAVDSVTALPAAARLSEPLRVPETRTAAPLVTSIGRAAEPQGAAQDFTGASIGSTQDPSIGQELVPATLQHLEPALEDGSEDREGEAQTESAPVVRLVRVIQRTPGFARSTPNRSVTPRLTRRVTPSPVLTGPVLTGPLPSRPNAHAAAPVARQAVPRIVRRPTAPVIATTSAS